MKLNLDPSIPETRKTTAESLALARWYDSRPAIRRLWGIKDAQKLRVIVALEPTVDDDDIFPTWFAHADAWSSELRRHTGSPVQLELIQAASVDEIEIDAGCVIIAELFWRDATLNQPYIMS